MTVGAYCKTCDSEDCSCLDPRMMALRGGLPADPAPAEAGNGHLVPPPEAVSGNGHVDREDASDGLKEIDASDVKMRPVLWLLRDRIALRALNLVAGEGGMGKSTLVANWVARATRGQLDGRFRGEPVNVLWIGTEEGREDVVVPRLKVAGADLGPGRVTFLTLDSDSLADEINVVTNIDAIRARCQRRDVKLVVIDPVVEYLPGSTDSHNDMGVRQALRPLRKVAEEIDTAVLGLIHFNKGATLHVATRLIGSAGFRNAARSVLVVADHPEDEKAQESWRVVFQNKTNWGPEDHHGHAYRVEGIEVTDHDGKVMTDYEGKPFTTARIAWGGEVELDPRTLPSNNGERPAPERDEAVEWLTDLLSDGMWCSYKEIERLSKEAGIARQTLHRARKDAGIVVERDERAQGRPSRWRLPLSSQDVSSQEVSSQPRTPAGGTKHSTLLTSENTTHEGVSSHDLVSYHERAQEGLADWSFAEAEPCIVCNGDCTARDPHGRIRHPACHVKGDES